MNGFSTQKKRATSRRLKTAQAFSLIEMLTVMTIIMILAGLATGVGRYAIIKAKRSRASAEIATLEMALEQYHSDQGFYPSNYPSCNSAILYKALATGAKKYFTPLSYQIAVSIAGVTNFADPFGSQYCYMYPGTNCPLTFDLWSNGPDKIQGTADDIDNWK